MKTILIAGGSGFIGSNLCHKMLSEGHKIICLDNLSTGNKSNIDGFLANPNFKFIEHDIINPIPDFNCKIDEIYNLACPASPPKYQIDPIHTFKTSIYGSLNLLEVAKANDATVIFSSTSEVYGDPEQHPQKEDYRGNVNIIGIRSCYDEGKRAAETLHFDYHRFHGVKIKVMRFFNTYGPNMDPNDGRVVSNFINQALRGEDITIYGDGSQTRSFCYIDDLIDAIVRVSNSKDEFLGPVNLGNPVEFTVKELAEKVTQLIKGDSKVVYKALPQDDPKQRKPDISLAQKELGWSPKINLEEGLLKTTDYFKRLLKA